MRFLATKSGTVHVMYGELDLPSCPVVTKAKNAGTWKGQRSLKPEKVLEMGDCLRCESHKKARAEVTKANKTAEDQRLNEKEVKRFNSKREGTSAKVTARKGTMPFPSKVQPIADERTT